MEFKKHENLKITFMVGTKNFNFKSIEYKKYIPTYKLIKTKTKKL